MTLYDCPVLVVDPGMHTAVAKTADADAEGRFLVTGSTDKTVRIWSAVDGTLLRTIRMPAGPGYIGGVYAVAMSPDGSLIAAGGWSNKEEGEREKIYLFDRSTGKMTGLIGGLPNPVNGLDFSANGQYLAAVCDAGGLRVFDKENNWREAFRDETYSAASHGVAFANDGRLATSSIDRTVRLYGWGFRRINLAEHKRLLPRVHLPASATDRTVRLHVRSFGRVAIQRRLRGYGPFRLAFHPDGKVLAVGYADKEPLVDLLDGYSLKRLPGPTVDGLQDLALGLVAWSTDGQTLIAGGAKRTSATGNILTWDRAGHGTRSAITAKCAESDSDTMALVSIAGGRLLIAKYVPCFTMLKTDGEVLWAHGPAVGDFGGQEKAFSVSPDGTIIDFSFEQFGKFSLRFDLRALKLSNNWSADDRTRPPKQDGLPIENWNGSREPKLNGKSIALDRLEPSWSLSIHSDAHRFILGAEWSLRAFDADGKELWRRPAPGTVWAVNITGDGRIVVAAYGDGSIRWHRMDDGRELLALQVLSDKKNWVAWTPEGFYDATPGAFGALRWHVNRGNDAAADAVPVSAIRKLKRPDALPLVIQELETARALGIADLAAARSDVQIATGAAVAPGARLHVLAIGISDYGDKAASLRLKFAAKDANDVANALLATQGTEFNKKGGLYADVKTQYLPDENANRAAIYRALGFMKANMANDATGQDVALILFSGHGAIIGDRFYLLPYGVDATRTPTDLKASAISANEFHDEVAELAKYGRVLVLLDACRSGAVTGDGSPLTSNADLLRLTIEANNVTVLTSSTSNEFSREDDKWKNGAFTKVLLEALADADEDQDGLISMSDLTRYISTHVPILTRDSQHPGVQQRFECELFISSQYSQKDDGSVRP